MTSPSEIPRDMTREERFEAEPPSGIHLRLDQPLVVLERGGKRRHAWETESGPAMGRIEMVGSVDRLAARVGRAARPVHVATALSASLVQSSRHAYVAALLQALHPRPHVLRLVVDIRRADLQSVHALLEAGAVVCSDDGSARHQAHHEAWGTQTTAQRWKRTPSARIRLTKMIGATTLSDRLDLTPAQHAALRALMDTFNATQAARSLSVSDSTMRGHTADIRARADVSDLNLVLREAIDASIDASAALPL
ncbi:MAG: hypothetical protein CMN30_26540 [Sandaracinus sp.]|nr:hypothetical protein [Sandaracinus sp.]|tara:strand:+ start:439 stop:1194 length:756 start_codon:yes stop_codon:yes gene_type:complete